MDRIKETPFEDLVKEDKVALVLVLLKQLQPYLSVNNLSTALPQQHLMAPTMPNQSKTTRAQDLPSYQLSNGGRGARDSNVRKSHGQGITAIYHPPQ